MEIKAIDETTLLLKGVRTSFMCVFSPKLNTLNGKEEYSVDLLLPKLADLTPLKKAAEAAMLRKFSRVIVPKYPFIKDGDDRINKEGEPVDGYPGVWYVTAKSLKAPAVVDGLKNPITARFDFQSGDVANVLVNVYAYDKSGNRGVAFELVAIQKAADGERFGGGISKTAAVSMFDTAVEDMDV